MKLIFSTFWKGKSQGSYSNYNIRLTQGNPSTSTVTFFSQTLLEQKVKQRERERERERGYYLWLGFYWCRRRWATPGVVGNQSENRKRMVSMFQTKWVTVQNGFNVSDEVVKMGTEPTDPIIQIYFPQKKKIILIYDK